LREKAENRSQYEAYVDELKPVREELGEFLFLEVLMYRGFTEGGNVAWCQVVRSEIVYNRWDYVCYLHLD
jgi:hypothetical protein